MTAMVTKSLARINESLESEDKDDFRFGVREAKSFMNTIYGHQREVLKLKMQLAKVADTKQEKVIDWSWAEKK